MSTKIEWADDTENAASGCSEEVLPNGKMDPACVNCYARLQSARCASMGMALYDGVAERTGNAARWTGVFRWDRDMLRRKFDRMKGGHRVFLGSMTDLWHEKHEPGLLVALAEEIRRLGERPREKQPFLITLTKRAGRLLIFQREHFPDGLPIFVWPGVTAGCQDAANARIPVLLQVKAGGPRVVSVEPMTGPVDISPWIGYYPHHETTEQGRKGLRGDPKSLDGDSRRRIDLEDSATTRQPMGLDGEGRTSSTTSRRCTSRRGLSNREVDGRRSSGVGTGPSIGVAPPPWADSTGANDQPQKWGQGGQPPIESGIGNVCRADGTSGACSENRKSLPPEWGGKPRGETERRPDSRDTAEEIGGREVERTGGGVWDQPATRIEDRQERAPAIGFVIAGGESGAKARPPHPDWFRALRDQCVAAGVPFFFKQWGEFCEVNSEARDPETGGHIERDPSDPEDAARFVPGLSIAISAAGRVVRSLDDLEEGVPYRHMQRVGKHAAGRLLDGRTWDEVPHV